MFLGMSLCLPLAYWQQWKAKKLWEAGRVDEPLLGEDVVRVVNASWTTFLDVLVPPWITLLHQCPWRESAVMHMRGHIDLQPWSGRRERAHVLGHYGPLRWCCEGHLVMRLPCRTRQPPNPPTQRRRRSCCWRSRPPSTWSPRCGLSAQVVSAYLRWSVFEWRIAYPACLISYCLSMQLVQCS